jgi:iron(III) transport system substrate-binding protein
MVRRGRWFGTAGIGALVGVMLVVAGCSSGSSSTAGPSSSAPAGSVSLTTNGAGAPPAASGSAAGVSGQTITVYSGQHEQTTQALVADFEKRTGVSVKLKSDDEASLAGQVLQEGSASPADVFFAENPPALTTLQENNLLTTVDASTLSQVPTKASSPGQDWVGVSARAVAFAANNSVPASSLPASVMDLAGPAWKGKLGLAPSETDFSPLINAVIKAKGADAAKSWLQALMANGKVFADNETLISAIDKGEVQGGLVDHYYWYRLRDEVGASKVASGLHYFPAGDPGSLVDVSGAAVLKSSSHAAAAQAFLAYLVSAPAQQIIATSHSYEYPLRPGASSSADLPPMGAIVSPAELGDGKPALALLQDVGLL